MNLKAFLLMAHLAFNGGWVGLAIEIGPEANLHQVVKDVPVYPGSRTTIICHPGVYRYGTTNLFKNGVDWYGMPGAIIYNTSPTAPFDNTWTGYAGACTSAVYGYFELVDASLLSTRGRRTRERSREHFCRPMREANHHHSLCAAAEDGQACDVAWRPRRYRANKVLGARNHAIIDADDDVVLHDASQ